jgi:hypothetical protein
MNELLVFDPSLTFGALLLQSTPLPIVPGNNRHCRQLENSSLKNTGDTERIGISDVSCSIILHH